MFALFDERKKRSRRAHGKPNRSLSIQTITQIFEHCGIDMYVDGRALDKSHIIQTKGQIIILASFKIPFLVFLYRDEIGVGFSILFFFHLTKSGVAPHQR